MKEMSMYMEKERPEKIEGDDYAMMATLFAKIPGNEVKADENFEKAIASDSSVKGKIAYADQAANMYAKVGKYPGQFKWLSKKAALKSNLGEVDYYYWCDAGIKATEYGKTEEIAKNYITAFPDKPQGYVFRTRAAILADKDTTAGTALEAIDQQTAFLMGDTVKNKGRILQNYGYKVYYYGKIKNYEKALESCNAILAVDPNNAYATSVIAEIQRLLKGSQKTPVAPAGSKPSGQTPAPPAKPAKP
jgi:tetratricopeptide (TPR) repeat protein